MVILSKNIAQITAILRDLATVVHENGVMVNSIQEGISKAKDWTKKGEQNLIEAKEYEKKADKKKCWVCTCVLMTMVVVGAPTILTTLQNLDII